MDDMYTVVDNTTKMKKIEKPKKIIVTVKVPSDFKKKNEDILFNIFDEIS